MLAPCVCIPVVDSAERKANNALDELGMVYFTVLGMGVSAARALSHRDTNIQRLHIYRTRCNSGFLRARCHT